MEVVLFTVALNKVYDQLKSALVNEVKLTKNARKELDKLTSIVTTIANVQEDAEERQVSDHALLDWLRKLGDALYDADDVVDAFATEALRRKSRGEQMWKVVSLWVRDFFSWSSNPVLFDSRLGHRVKRVLGKLDSIAAERTKFHLKESDPRERLPIGYREQIVSYVVKSEVVGRDADREAMVARLRQRRQRRGGGDGDVGRPEVVSIVGMAGIGKTTLAQLVYNDEWVERSFDHRIWVCVSENFDVTRLTREIVEQTTGQDCELLDLESLRPRLTEALAARRFLLVLDDVWNDGADRWRRLENYSAGQWRRLEDSLRCGAPGSKILVTTREGSVSTMMESLEPYHLGLLLEEDCWDLLKQRAFAGGREENPRLVAIGREVARKCGGLPLAATLLGSLLFCKKTEREWDLVKGSGMWDLPVEAHDILPALKLSYTHLPPKSRFCFAYCSIFPKGYEMEKMTLVRHWIANGFIVVSQSSTKELEDVGMEIFDDLLSRSFFQDAKRDEYGSITKCKMHDLIHDLARSVVEDVCSIILLNSSRKVEGLPRRIRHLSIHEGGSSEIPKALYKARTLHTLQSLSARVVNKRVLAHVLTDLKFLRVLDLRSANIEKVPIAINNLKHLRYVDFSNTKIKELPNTTSQLLNLQTLRLNGCRLLVELPKRMRSLVNLRHLEIVGCCLTYMPRGMDQLSCLQTLSDFVVSKDGAALKELQRLNLGGKLSIQNLENSWNEKDAELANLSGKRDLIFLELSWTKLNNPGNPDPDMQEGCNKVLNALQPHACLKQLKLVNYIGSRFPTWMTDSPQCLVKVILSYCSWCEYLPEFGQLCNLVDLRFMGLHAIKNIDRTFYGAVNGFPSLKELALSDMPKFETWLGLEGVSLFPSLYRLTISNCPMLNDMPRIPSLQRVEIWNCNATLLKSVANLASLSTLIIGKMLNLASLTEESFENLTSLRKLYITDCIELVSFSDNAMQHLAALQHMEIIGCKELVSLPSSMCHLKSLRYLKIRHCSELAIVNEGLQGLTSLESVKMVGCLSTSDWSDAGMQKMCSVPDFQIEVCHKKTAMSRWLQYPNNIHLLRIHGDHGFNRFHENIGGNNLNICCCKDIDLFPKELQMASALEVLEIRNCNGLTALPQKIGDLISLETLSIIDCPKVTCLPGRLNKVQFLCISGCSDLEKRCENQGEDWNLISHIPSRKIG